MSTQGYGQFCPVAMAAEVVASRWTLVLLSEMQAGSTRFNEIRRGVPRMSPALLSKRLKDLERQGVVRRTTGRHGTEYRLTEAGHDLAPIIRALGEWSMRWIDNECTLANLDAQLLMWNMRRKIDPRPLPPRRVVVEFSYPELPRDQRRYWLIVSPANGVDLCSIDPGFDVDLYVTADLKAMTSAWMGMSDMSDEIVAERITLVGDPDLVRTLTSWLRPSSFARVA
ncbi:winged helix-turn-helix transcriptional regulator [Tsuneonella sp. SYSU-LHT278]|uniref:winged helix-turn-helix transcriptional regulator n=1 Tax=Tsuneonella sediminis TaxID=3416089 RepID=UPI003F79F2C6